MARLVDVAARAGVSKSTVSNVIRGGVLVAPETRARVERAIAETGYRPNAIARSLQARSSRVLGLMVPDLANPFFAQLAIGVERGAGGEGYAVLIAHTECETATEIAAAAAFLERQVDGVIVAGMSPGAAWPGTLLEHGVPVAMAGLGHGHDPRAGSIDHDTDKALEAIVDHLHGLGHRRFAFLPHAIREQGREARRLAFEAALARRGLSPVPEAAATALVAHDDLQAVAAMDRLERAGRRVPQDVSLVGYDDIPLAAHCRIGLTTIRAEAATLGRRAAELVIGAARRGRPVMSREVLPSALVVRASTASAAAGPR